jgi:hypothetical protein
MIQKEQENPLKISFCFQAGDHVKGNCGLIKYISVIVKSDAYSY